MIGERIKRHLKGAPLGWAFFASVMAHIVLILLHWQPAPMQTGEIVRGPMQVMLAPKEKPATEPVKQVTPPPKPKKEKPVKIKKPAKPSKPKATPKVMAKIVEETPQEFTVPEELAQIPEPEPVEIIPLPDTPPPSSPSAPTDMMSLIKQKREAKAAMGDPLAINALEEGKLAGQTVHKSAEDIVQKNLRNQGGKGAFIITTMTRFEATFVFQGWRGEYSNAQRSYYSVNTFDTSEDIRVLVVKKVIELIYSEYNNDSMTWYSRRYPDGVLLSLKKEDHEQLLDFLIEDFKWQFDKF